MEIIVVSLMSLTATGVALWAMNRSSNRVFRYTSFEDEEGVQHIFLVYSPNFELAQQDAKKMIALNELQIQKVDELDAKTWDVINTPYKRTEKSSIKTQKIK